MDYDDSLGQVQEEELNRWRQAFEALSGPTTPQILNTGGAAICHASISAPLGFQPSCGGKQSWPAGGSPGDGDLEQETRILKPLGGGKGPVVSITEEPSTSVQDQPESAAIQACLVEEPNSPRTERKPREDVAVCHEIASTCLPGYHISPLCSLVIRVTSSQCAQYHFLSRYV